MATRIPHRVALATLSLGALLSACGGGGGGGPAASPTPTPQPTVSIPTATPPPAPTATATPSPTATPAPEGVYTTVFFIRSGFPMAVRRLVDPITPVRGSVEALIAGPAAAETAVGMSSDLPRAVQLEGAAVSGGVATVNFSPEFAAGSADSLARRVTQVVDTLTELGTVHSVLFRVSGAPVASLGGIALSAPVTRAAVERWQPAILVEAPVVDQTVSSPLRIWGTANVFEATFRIRMSAGGSQVFDEQVHATSGTGTRGSFDVTVRFTASGPAVLEAYEVSMKDGSHVNVVDIPLTLATP